MIRKAPLKTRLKKLPKAIVGSWKLNKGVPLTVKIQWAISQSKIILSK